MPRDNAKFLQLLEFATGILSSNGKFTEAKMCAKEMRDFYMKLPPSFDDMMNGLRNIFSFMSHLNHVFMETHLPELLENISPHIYSCV